MSVKVVYKAGESVLNKLEVLSLRSRTDVTTLGDEYGGRRFCTTVSTPVSRCSRKSTCDLFHGADGWTCWLHAVRFQVPAADAAAAVTQRKAALLRASLGRVVGYTAR